MVTAKHLEKVSPAFSKAAGSRGGAPGGCGQSPPLCASGAACAKRWAALGCAQTHQGADRLKNPMRFFTLIDYIKKEILS